MENSLSVVKRVADQTWEHMHSSHFWIEPNVSLVSVCNKVAKTIGLKLTPKQLRHAAKEIERKMV
jgi:hypothetical protein